MGTCVTDESAKLLPGHEGAENLHLSGLRSYRRREFDRAAELLGRAADMEPRNAVFQCDLGSALKAVGRVEESIRAFERALAIEPDHSGALNNLGNAFYVQKRLAQAVECYQRALALEPHNARTHYNLGVTLRAMERLPEAVEAYQRAIALQPDFADAFYNQAHALRMLGRVDEAIKGYQRAVELQPGFAKAHYDLGLALLLRGDYARGWTEQEWRWKCEEFPTPRRDFRRPRWDGAPLNGRTIHLHAEQGFGDTIHFVRYFDLVKARGGRIVAECQPQLKRLIARMPAVSHVVTTGEPLVDFDVHCPLLSLPAIFGTTLETIPARVPYLEADPADAKRWASRLAAHAGKLKVGLVWSGNALNRNDFNRSLAFSSLAPLIHTPGAVFVSLQKGEAAEQLRQTPEGAVVFDGSEELHDFSETAALAANLDLVIAVDTAVGHLAGALARPVWLLTPFAPDWRWGLAGEKSLWYPTLRLFRQSAPGEWTDVLTRVAEALRQAAVSS